MAAPTWLTSQYLQQALRLHYECEDLHVKMLQLEPALTKGENYGAVLTRIRLVYSKADEPEQELHLIAKTVLEQEDAETRAKKAPYDIYNRELRIYDEILPELQRLAGEQLCPLPLHVDRQHGALLLEDLGARGYIMADRLQRLNESHVRLVLAKLAKLHAASAILQQEAKQLQLQSYDCGFFNRHTESYQSYFVGCLQACAAWLAKQPGYELYAEKLQLLAPHYMALGLRCFEPEATHLNVLTHGDVWTNNLLFKYDASTGAPCDVLLIDFQYAFWGSATLDVHHLVNTSAVELLRAPSKQLQLRQFYHSEFVALLQKLQFTGRALPSLKQFHLESEQKRFYAVHCGLLLQPVLLNNDATDADFGALLSEQQRGRDLRKRLYLNAAIQESVKALVVALEQEGLLEVEQYTGSPVNGS